MCLQSYCIMVTCIYSWPCHVMTCVYGWPHSDKCLQVILSWSVSTGGFITTFSYKLSYRDMCPQVILSWHMSTSYLFVILVYRWPYHDMFLQVLVQRLLSAKNTTHAKAGSIMAGYMKILPLFLMAWPGIIARILFPGNYNNPYQFTSNKHDCNWLIQVRIFLICKRVMLTKFIYNSCFSNQAFAISR